MSEPRLVQLAKTSHNLDRVMVELLYLDKYVTFDMPFMEVKYLTLDEIHRKYFAEAFAAIDVPIACEASVPTPTALSSSSETNV